MQKEKTVEKKELPEKRKIAIGKKIKIMFLAWVCWKLWSIPWKKARRGR